MSSTPRRPDYVKVWSAAVLRSLLALGLGWQFATGAAAMAAQATAARAAASGSAATPRIAPLLADTRIPRPAALERDVRFWIRVYSEIPTSAGFMHDERDLTVVYETLRFQAGSKPADRKPIVDDARDRYAQLLRRLAAVLAGEVPPAGAVGEVADAGSGAGASGQAPAAAALAASRAELLSRLTPEERRVLELWGPDVTPQRLLEASRGVRFQLGQADRFREGLIRSGRWESHIAQSLASLGLPPELAALPHVESSFDPTAYSKVGAAGLWQFMPSTGRRYLRVDGDVVDERLDPFRATEAAAQLLAFNYRVLGTWPLALTAYNHGAAGMRRAVEQTGTTDFVTIARNYQSRSFGFASRNFYPSFLAALTIDQNPEKFFGPIERAPELRFHEIEMPAYARIDALTRALGVTREALREYNPGIRPPVWEGRRLLPRGYRLRLASPAADWTPERLAAALGPDELYAGQMRSGTHRVASGETLARIARRHGVTERALAEANGLAPGTPLKRGRRLRLPETMPPRLADAARGSVAATVAASGAAPGAAPATAAAGTGTAPGPTATAEPATAGLPEFYRVRAGDSLYAIARRFELRPGELMQLNGIRDPNFLYEGQRLRIVPARAAAAAAEPATRAESVPESAPEPARVAEAPAGPASSPSAVADAEATQVEPQSPAVGPAVGGAAGAEFADLAVARDDTIRVISEETLGHYADWLGVTAARLRSLNRLRAGQPVLLGRRLKLDFSRVSRADFEQKRREFHVDLQSRYFEDWRIVGTEAYVVQRGDSAWAISQRHGAVPAWLLQQYNPDVDLGELRAGTQLIVPRVQGPP
jgi:membrane-bound lytic murein transglycosylase D